MANIYKGFSTKDRIRPPYTLTNGEAVKTDLLNELYTKRECNVQLWYINL